MDQEGATDFTDKAKGMKGEEFLFKELTGDISDTAMGMLNVLRPGLDEKVYRNA